MHAFALSVVGGGEVEEADWHAFLGKLDRWRTYAEVGGEGLFLGL